MREQVLNKYLPRIVFEDHSPQQLVHDEENDITEDELQRGISLRAVAHIEAERLYDEVVESTLLDT